MFRKDSTGRSESSRPANPIKRLSTAALAAVLSIALIVPQAWADQSAAQATLNSQSQQLEVEQSDEASDTQSDGPTDWTDSFGRLTLSSETGLSADDVSDEQKQGNAELTELPEQIAATLGLDVALKAGRTIIAGDYLYASLPDGVTAQTYADDDADDEAKRNATFDVLRRDDDQDSDVKIAEARFVSQSRLKITFVDPVNVNTGEAADPIEEAAARLQLKVNLDSSLVKNKSSELKWTLQTKADDSADDSTSDSASKTTTRETKLVIPSKRQIAAKLGITLKTNSLSRSAAPLPATVSETVGEADGETSTKTYMLSGSRRSTFVTLWADNNSDERPQLDNVKSEYRLYFTLDGETYPLTDEDGATVSSEAQSQLGMTQNQLNAYMSDGSLLGFAEAGNQYNVTSVTLPDTVVISDGQTSETKSVVFSIKHDGIVENQTCYDGRYFTASATAYPDYVGYGDDGRNGKECLQLTEDVTFNFKLGIGNEDEELLNEDGTVNYDKWAETWGDSNTLTISWVDDDGTTKTRQYGKGTKYPFSQLVERGMLSFSINTDEDTAILEAKDWVQYHPNGNPMTYSLTVNCEESTGEYKDYYQVSYDNAKASNHGSDTTALYNGGTVTIIHAGTTSFDATKVWLDEDPSDRPATEYTLWRYSLDGGSTADNAAQVRASDGSFVTFSMSAEDNQALGENASVDLGGKLDDKYSDDGKVQLAKYDADGYPYIYLLRESKPDGYERVYGAVNEDGTTVDTAPNYYDIAHENTVNASDGEFTRNSRDISVYNNGTITNRRKDDTQVGITKTWKAGTFQDQLKEIEVTLTLQRMLKADTSCADSDDVDDTTKKAARCVASEGSEWQDVTDGDGNVVTKKVTGWYAEKLTQTVSGTYEKYDSLGRQYVYRWVETGVAQEGYDTQFASDGDGTSFKLQLKDNDGTDMDVDFVGEYDASTNTITNRYVAVTDTHVVKKWLNSQGEEISGPSEDPAYKNVSSVKIKLLQDDELVGTYELDGTADSEATKITSLSDDAEVRETEPWRLDFTNLPLYDSEGRRHTYVTLEVSGNYTSSYKYDYDTRTKTITNRPPTGDHTIIAVAKKWVDDGNASHRVEVTAGIYALKDLTDASGKVLYPKGERMATVTLNKRNQWYGEASVNGISGTLTMGKDYEIREIAVDGSQYEVVSKSDIEDDKYSALEYQSLLVNWDNDNERMLTSDRSFAYEITYGYNKELGCAQITNRRIGQLWIDVVKTWTDDGATKSNRPNASFILTCDEYADKDLFHTDDDGSIYMTLPNNPDEKLYVYTGGDGATSETISKLKVANGDANTNAVEITDGGKGLKVTVCDKDKVEGEAHIHFYALPKYDYGAILHYSVQEIMPDDSKGDYVGHAYTPTESLSSTWRFHDTAEYKFDNQREGTKDVTFHTKWYDTYVNKTLNQRPDIYLTLYRTVYDYDNLDDDGNPTVSYEQFDDYEAYAWQTDSEHRKSYNQKAVIKDLPKYDDHGREIFYYATAKTSVSADMVESLGYDPQFFTYGENGDDDCVDEYCGTADWDKATASDAEKAAAAKSVELSDQTSGGINLNQAIREDGTINFTISGDMLAKGEKLWKNVPTGFAEADLPDISMHVQRRMAGGQYQSSDGTMVSTCSVAAANAGTCTWSSTETEWGTLKLRKITDGDGNATGYEVVGVETGESQDVADGVSEVASTNQNGLTRVSANKYTYEISHYGVNGTDDEDSDADSLPKYDKFGRRYEYRAREIIDGLINYNDGSGVPGGFSVDDLLADDSTSETLSSKVYRISHGETGSFVIENTYSSSKGSLKVTKQFQGRTDKDTKYPDVTFRLYRSYVTSDGTRSSKTLVGTQTLNGNQITQCSTSSIDSTDATQGLAGDSSALRSASGSIGASGNGCGTVTFGDLDIFTPGGQYWIYTLEEDSANGYTSDATSITLNEPAEGANPTGTPLTPNDSTLELSPNTGVKDAKFTNTYTAEEAALTGTKVWNDRGNQLNTRPETLTLKLTRADQDGTSDPNLTDGVVELSTEDDCTKNCLAWVKNGDNTWTYNITKVDKWAPNGKPWKYTVQEVLSTDAESKDSQYAAKNANGGSVDAGDPSNPAKFPNNLENYLTTTASVQKKWSGDGKDERQQRPKVYVELQARITDGEGTVVQGWARADTALKNVLGDAFNASQFGSSEIEQFWSPGVTMKDEYRTHTWKNLATQVYDTNGTAYNVSWRAVETKLIYDNNGTRITVDINNPDDSGEYQTYKPYQPSQSTTGTTTTITNTLTNVTVYATKTWDDQSNAWTTRPGSSSSNGTWKTTFRLQRRTADTEEWAWVTKYGANVQNGFDSNVITVTVSANGTDTATGTFANLPSVNNEGNTYQYRLVEELTGSYQVDGGTVLACKSGNTVSDPSDGACAEGTNAQLVVTDGDAMDASTPQTFTNKLQTVTLSGTKAWNDYGTGLVSDSMTAETMASLVKLTVQRRISDGEWQNVTKTENGQSAAPTVTWQKNDDGSWTFTTEAMPKTDANGNVYQYRAVEENASAQGFYPVYGSEDSSTRTDDGNWRNVALTNTATRFKLNKIGDDTTGSGSEPLNDVELQIQKDGKLYAIWQRDENGAESSRMWVDGTEIADEPAGGVAGTDGYIIGLPAGTYDVKETKLPSGHVKVDDFKVTIASDGSVTLEGSPSQVAIENPGSATDATFTVTDSVFRSRLKLDKTFTHNDSRQPVSGMTFELYRMTGDSPSDTDVKIADITTDADGTWSSAAHNDVAWLNGERAFGDLAKYYVNQSDGVPAGSYYYKETGSTFDTVDDTGKVSGFAIAPATLDGAGAHGQTVDLTVENGEFNASVRITKIDSETGSSINGAKFTLEYAKSGSSESTVVAADLESGKSYAMNAAMSAVENNADADSGLLKITGLKKGSYTLIETADQGYAVSGKIVAKFTIDNADNAKTFDLAEQADRDAIDVTDVDSSVSGNGLANQPLHGTISLTKTAADDAAPLDGVTFKVQRKSNDAWIDIDALQDLRTGNTYAATVDQSGSITGTTQDESGTWQGVLMIRNLPWGTYRFVETSPQDGYSGQDSSGRLVSDEITLDRTSFGDADSQNTADAIDHNTSMTNAKTSLTISKSSSENGAKLAGAEFTITPAEASHFADNTASQVLVTGEDGNASISGQLVAGNSYLIEETKAPAGYKRITGTLKITVKNDGSITTDSTDAFANGSITLLDDSVVVEAEDEPIAFSITKKNADGETLQGAVFTLTPKPAEGDCAASAFSDGSTEAITLTTGDKGKASLPNDTANKTLVVGNTYTLEETVAPAGYIKVDSALTFTVQDDGSLQVVGEIPPAFSTTKNSGEIDVFTGDVANDPTQFHVTKVSATDPSRKLNGAEFQLTGIFAGQTGATTKTLTTDETGIATIDKAQLIADGQTEYTLTETKSPNGYLRLTQPYTFTVATNGTITSKQETTGYSVNMAEENATFTVTAADTPTALKLVKEAADLQGNPVAGQKLAGAVFTITPANDGETFADGTTAITVTTDNEGSTQLSAQLIAGHSYTIKETTAPEGYQMTDVTYTVTIDDQGNATWSIDGQTIGTDGKDGLFPQTADNDHQAIAVITNKTALAAMPHSGKIFGLPTISVAGLLLIAAGITAMAIARRRRNA